MFNTIAAYYVSTDPVYLNCALHHCHFLQLLTYKQYFIHNV